MNLLMIFLFFIIPTMLLILFYLINKMEKWDNSTSSSFECGFESFFFSRFSMSMQYFFFGLIFLLLDLELSILIPYYFLFSEKLKDGVMISCILSLILILLIMEFMNDMMEWKNLK